MPDEAPAPDLLFDTTEIQAVTNTTLPEPIALSLAILATAAVRDYCGWRVAKPAEETLTVTGSGTRKVFLPTLHINSVMSVLHERDVLLTEGVGFDWDTYGVLDRLDGRWSKTRRGIVATVNHGFEKCPGGIAQAIAAAVARGSLAPAAGITAESTLSASIQYSRAASGAAAGSIFLEHELAQLDAFRAPQSR